METTIDMPAETEVMVATDRVEFEGDHLLIHATEPMDWRIREFSKVPIWFRGQRYYLLNKRAGQPPRGITYQLAPWPDDLHGAASSQSVFYDEDYVHARNNHGGSVRRHDRMYPVLAPLYPVLGFAWSDFKNTTLARCGFDPEAITSASVYLTIVMFMVQSFFTMRLGCGFFTFCLGSRSYLLYDLGLILVLGVDIVIRYSHGLKGSLNPDSDRHLGFFQWIWPTRAK